MIRHGTRACCKISNEKQTKKTNKQTNMSDKNTRNVFSRISIIIYLENVYLFASLPNDRVGTAGGKTCMASANASTCTLHTLAQNIK